MDSITIRLNQELSKKINENLKPYYSTKTEFIREAIRDKLRALERESKPENQAKVKRTIPLSTEDRKKLFEEYLNIPDSQIIREINRQKRNG